MLLTLKTNNSLQIIGLMSGTSLDGVDITACTFYEDNSGWHFHLDAAETIPYGDEWKARLKNLQYGTAEELAFTHADIGKYFSELILSFNKKFNLHPDYIGSHGHTIFHQPSRNFTLQIGCGAQIAARTGIDTVCDFRTKDIALNGQGAPLVPIGDKLLFSSYSACINLGGISNISFEKNNERVAFDICPANMMLNFLANKLDKPYDENGDVARSGKLIDELLNKLNALDYYQLPGPKSLGKEWFDQQVLPLINTGEEDVKDLLRTCTEHIAVQHEFLKNITSPAVKILVSGGGAFNTFLIERIAALSGRQLEIPSADIINFKEAIVFAFLTALFVKGSENVLGSATGAVKNNCGGAFYRGG